MESLEQINQLQIERVSSWHAQQPQFISQGLLRLIEEQHLQNYQLWHEEDIARDPTVTNDEIARVKRSIDVLNQRRNDLIEQIDEMILASLHADGITINENSPMNSETPGNMIDRGSIMALKIYHMEEQTRRTDVDEKHRQQSLDKVRILRIQREDLFACLSGLIADIRAGVRHYKLYRQFKMYNDPSLNPQIYKVNQS
ncbi:MAG: DUF4254 domain-containing protein [bacterium]